MSGVDISLSGAGTVPFTWGLQNICEHLRLTISIFRRA